MTNASNCLFIFKTNKQIKKNDNPRENAHCIKNRKNKQLPSILPFSFIFSYDLTGVSFLHVQYGNNFRGIDEIPMFISDRKCVLRENVICVYKIYFKYKVINFLSKRFSKMSIYFS